MPMLAYATWNGYHFQGGSKRILGHFCNMYSTPCTRQKGLYKSSVSRHQAISSWSTLPASHLLNSTLLRYMQPHAHLPLPVLFCAQAFPVRKPSSSSTDLTVSLHVTLIFEMRIFTHQQASLDRLHSIKLLWGSSYLLHYTTPRSHFRHHRQLTSDLFSSPRTRNVRLLQELLHLRLMHRPWSSFLQNRARRQPRRRLPQSAS